MALTGEAGDKLLLEANKLCKPSVISLRLKPDWAQATPLFEKAAIAFKHVKAFDKARRAYEKAALGWERQDSQWHAAKFLEQAAEMARQAGDWEASGQLSKQAAMSYSEAGRAQAAAEALAKAAKSLEDRDPKGACEMYSDALERIEADGKEAMGQDIYRQAIGCYIRQGRLQDAGTSLLRFAVTCDASGANSSLCRSYLGAVVVFLYATDARGAWAAHQDALEVAAYGSSQQARAAEDLFDAYRSGDGEAVKNCILSSAIFGDLDNQVLRLARKLPQGDVGALAASLGGAAPIRDIADLRLDDDDLT